MAEAATALLSPRALVGMEARAMKVGDMLIVRYGEMPCKVRPRIAIVARVEPLGVRLAAGQYGGGRPPGQKAEFRPRWATKVHALTADAVVREATRREVVLGHPDMTIGLERAAP